MKCRNRNSSNRCVSICRELIVQSRIGVASNYNQERRGYVRVTLLSIDWVIAQHVKK